MLYLNRRAGEAVIINNAIEVRVVEVRGKTVRLGLQLPTRRVGAARGGLPADPRRERGGGPRPPPSLLGRHWRAGMTAPAAAPLVAVVMGSQSDWATMRHAATVLDELGVPHEARIVSAHRTPERLYAFAKGARAAGVAGDRRRGRRGGAPAGHDRRAHHPAGAGRAGREQGAARASTACTRSSRCRAACRSARWRSAGRAPSTRRCWRPAILALADPALDAALAAWRTRQTEAVAETPDDAGAREPRSRRARTIGILGGGQLGRMTAMAAARLGYRCHILAPEADSPAADVAAAWTRADYDDEAALTQFAAAVDVVTLEFENVPVATRSSSWPRAARSARAPRVLRVTQDRLAEKDFVRDAGHARSPATPASRSAADLALALRAAAAPAC